MRLLPDDRTGAYNENRAVILQDFMTGETKSFAETSEDVFRYPAAVTPDGSMIIFSEEDATIKVWDLKRSR